MKRVAIGPENEVHCRELLLNSPMAGLYMDKRHAKRRNDAPLGPAGPAILGRLFVPCQGRPEWGDAAALPKKAAGHPARDAGKALSAAKERALICAQRKSASHGSKGNAALLPIPPGLVHRLLRQLARDSAVDYIASKPNSPTLFPDRGGGALAGTKAQSFAPPAGLETGKTLPLGAERPSLATGRL